MEILPHWLRSLVKPFVPLRAGPWRAARAFSSPYRARSRSNGVTQRLSVQAAADPHFRLDDARVRTVRHPKPKPRVARLSGGRQLGGAYISLGRLHAPAISAAERIRYVRLRQRDQYLG